MAKTRGWIVALTLGLSLAWALPVGAETGIQAGDACTRARARDALLWLDMSATGRPVAGSPHLYALDFTGRLRGLEEAGVDARDYVVFVTYPDAGGQHWIAGTLELDREGRPSGPVTIDAGNFAGLYRLKLLNQKEPCSSGEDQDFRLIRGAPPASPGAGAGAQPGPGAGLLGQ